MARILEEGTLVVSGDDDHPQACTIAKAKSLAKAGAADPYQRALAMGEIWRLRGGASRGRYSGIRATGCDPEDLREAGISQATWRYQRRLARLAHAHPWLRNWDTSVSGARANVARVIREANIESAKAYVAKRTRKD